MISVVGAADPLSSDHLTLLFSVILTCLSHAGCLRARPVIRESAFCSCFIEANEKKITTVRPCSLLVSGIFSYLHFSWTWWDKGKTVTHWTDWMDPNLRGRSVWMCGWFCLDVLSVLVSVAYFCFLWGTNSIILILAVINATIYDWKAGCRLRLQMISLKIPISLFELSVAGGWPETNARYVTASAPVHEE